MKIESLDEINDEIENVDFLEEEKPEEDYTQGGKFLIIEKICLVQKCKIMRKTKSSVKKVPFFNCFKFKTL